MLNGLGTPKPSQSMFQGFELKMKTLDSTLIPEAWFVLFLPDCTLISHPIGGLHPVFPLISLSLAFTLSISFYISFSVYIHKYICRHDYIYLQYLTRGEKKFDSLESGRKLNYLFEDICMRNGHCHQTAFFTMDYLVSLWLGDRWEWRLQRG